MRHLLSATLALAVTDMTGVAAQPSPRPAPLPVVGKAEGGAEGGAEAAPPVLTCEHANAPSDNYIGWVDKETGRFLFHCLIFADRTGVAFQMSYRAPPVRDNRPAGVIGGGWGTDFDDVARGESGGRVAIRNGADGSIDTYAARRRGSPLLVAGDSSDQRARRAQGCDYVEHEQVGGVRRVDCFRNIQHFGGSGRLIRYSTHRFHQVFELNWGDGLGPTVTGDRAILTVTGAAPDGRTIVTALKRQGDARLVVTDQDDRRVVLRFDSAGHLTDAQSAAGEGYGFTYAPDGTLIAVRFPDGSRQTMAYDARGRIVAIAGRDGRSTRFTDRHGRTDIVERGANGVTGGAVGTFGCGDLEPGGTRGRSPTHSTCIKDEKR